MKCLYSGKHISRQFQVFQLHYHVADYIWCWCATDVLPLLKERLQFEFAVLIKLFKDYCLNSRNEESKNREAAFVQDVFNNLEDDFCELFTSDSVHDMHVLLLVVVLWLDLVVGLWLLLPLHEIQLFFDEVDLQDHELSLLPELFRPFRLRSAVIKWQSVYGIPQLIELDAILYESQNLWNPVSIQRYLIRQ